MNRWSRGRNRRNSKRSRRFIRSRWPGGRRQGSRLPAMMRNLLEKPLVMMLFWACLLVGGSVLIPVLVVQHESSVLDRDPFSIENIMDPDRGQDSHYMDDASIVVPIYMSEQQRIEELPLEGYVRGVVAAEMPAEFDLEALKAQAIAARTYIVRRIVDKDFSHVPVDDAWVTDTVQHQAFLSVDEMRQRWGWYRFSTNWNKVTQAVEETRNIVLTYDGRPIEASYFSTSNGYTENSEDYWDMKTDYLRSVPSPWDEHISPKYEQSKTFTPVELANLLDLEPTAVASDLREFFRVTERTEGQRVKEIVAGGQTFTGREIREKLGLASSHFEMNFQADEVQVTTYGYGHGVGMSQYGAQGMALEGTAAEDILKHYYQGVQLEPISKLAITTRNLAKVIEE